MSTESAASEPAATITYGESWNARDHCVGIPLTEAEARARNATGDTFYAALPPLPGEWHPVLVAVVWKNDFVQVEYFDELGRQYLSYGFKRHDSRMFLKSVRTWTYADDNPKADLSDAVKIERISLSPDGYATYLTTDKIANEKITKKYSDVPMDDMWEPIPEFGEYTSIARLHRGPQAAAFGRPRT